MWDNFQIGDQIEFNRGIYSHWGVYVGNGQVVHLKPAKAKLFEVNVVVGLDDVDTVAQDTWLLKFMEIEVKVNNYLERKTLMTHHPKSKEDILCFALSLVGQHWPGYSLTVANCECFANWLRYRKYRMGTQGNDLIGSLLAFMASIPVFGWYYSERVQQKVLQYVRERVSWLYQKEEKIWDTLDVCKLQKRYPLNFKELHK